MKITGVECQVLVMPDYDVEACSSAQDDIVVLVQTDEGITGVGEVDTNPWAVQALIKAPGTHVLARGLEEILIGLDPLDTEAIWERLYVGSLMSGRRGLGVCAIGALDIALWDIRGQALGVPCWKLLGGAAKDQVIPYASLLPSGRTVEEQQKSLVSMVIEAQRFGFQAAKVEVCYMGPYAHNNVRGSCQDVVETIAACRDAVGEGFTLMLDVCYAWSNAKEALGVLTAIEHYNLFFAETPLNLDDLTGYAFLHDHSPIRIAAGELLTGHFEFKQLIEQGKVDVAQPNVGRVGGLTEAKRVCDLGADYGVQIVPHCWKTAIGIIASLHLAAATSHCPYNEFLPPRLTESTLRRDLVLNEPLIQNGAISLPEAPGLGIQLNPDALKKYKASVSTFA